VSDSISVIARSRHADRLEDLPVCVSDGDAQARPSEHFQVIRGVAEGNDLAWSHLPKRAVSRERTGLGGCSSRDFDYA
jgi:hypothetical protein